MNIVLSHFFPAKAETMEALTFANIRPGIDSSRGAFYVPAQCDSSPTVKNPIMLTRQFLKDVRIMALKIISHGKVSFF